MKDKKQKTIILAISMITLLILSSIGSFGISNDIGTGKNTIQIENVKVKSNLVCIKTSSNSLSTLNEISKNDKKNNLDSLNFNQSENILVAGQDENESYPSIVANGANSFVAYEYEEGGEPYLYFTKSSNYGKNWSEPEKQKIEISQNNEISVNSPTLCIRPGKKYAYGIFFSSEKNSGIIGILDIPDISSFDSSYKIWDWSKFPALSQDFYSWWDFATPDIVYHDNPNIPWINGFIGSTNFSKPPNDYSATDSIMFTFLDEDEPDALWIQWDHQLEHCSNIDLDMDDNSKTFYGVCEIKNASNQDLLFFKGFHTYQGDQPTINLTYDKEVFSGLGNLTNPQILVKGEEIFIVAERDSQEIILFHSSNEGKTWTPKNITADFLPPGSNPKYPRISTNQTHLSCIFSEFGNLSFINSTNLGLNWSEPVQLNSQNGSVVEEYRYANIIQQFNLTYVIWTDNRNGNKDLYLAKEGDVLMDLMIVPESVNLSKDPDFPILSTNNWINFTVRNNGDVFVENIPVEITYSKNNTTEHTNYPVMILYLAGFGAEKKIQRPLFRMAIIEFFRSLIDFAGINNITITVDPNNKFEDSDLSNNAFTLENVSYADIFPKLGWLEEIILRFS